MGHHSRKRDKTFRESHSLTQEVAVAIERGFPIELLGRKFDMSFGQILKTDGHQWEMIPFASICFRPFELLRDGQPGFPGDSF